jgi:ParB-like chromosome segregation protein Spo0J
MPRHLGRNALDPLASDIERRVGAEKTSSTTATSTGEPKVTNNDADIPAEIQRNKDNKAPFHDKPEAPKKLQAHKYAELFPALDKDELKELSADIKQHGLLEPITLYQGFILDGRNRYQAARNAKLDLSTSDRSQFDTFTGSDTDALAFVISKNLQRRHLSTSQRAMIAADIATLQHGERPADRPDSPPTQATAASTLNVSERVVRKAKRVKDKGTKELQDAVRSGDIAVDTAAEVADLSPTKQKEVLKKAKAAPKGKASTTARSAAKKAAPKTDKKKQARVKLSIVVEILGSWDKTTAPTEAAKRITNLLARNSSIFLLGKPKIISVTVPKESKK